MLDTIDGKSVRFVEECLKVIWCSRKGLRESEILELVNIRINVRFYNEKKKRKKEKKEGTDTNANAEAVAGDISSDETTACKPVPAAVTAVSIVESPVNVSQRLWLSLCFG